MLKIKTYLLRKNVSPTDSVFLALTGILLFMISLPHSMAVRKFLIFVIFIMALKPFLNAMRDKLTELKILIWTALALQIWMLLITYFIAPHPIESFMEWKGQWMPVMMCLIVGVGLARVLRFATLENPLSAVAVLICAPIALFLCGSAVVMVKDMLWGGSALPYQLGITAEKGGTNFLIALIEPILVADMLVRIVKGKRLLPIPNWAISAFLALAIFSLFATSSRNGLVVMMFAFVLGAVMMIAEFRRIYSWQKIYGSVWLTLTIVAGVAYAAYKIDPRWQGFIETIPIAWDIDNNVAWVSADGVGLPITPSGTPVDPSQYYRIAWFHEGCRMLLAHPWGLEISRDTFHQLELQKYGRAEMFHSHNGWIDLGLNVGVFGLLLWGGFLWLLAKTGWQSWQRYKNPLGLALTLMTIMFVLRAMLDSIFRNHILEQFALVAGLLYTTLLYERSNDSNNNAS